MFTKPLALVLFSALASAVAQEYGGYGTTPAASSSSSASSASSTVAPTAPADTPGQMNIDVAFKGNFVFHPSNITAPVGTLVTFYYPNLGLTHSVTQSSFNAPCTYLAANTSANTAGGFDSGLQAGATFTINITDTNPIWFFCKQIKHCGLGMVGSINAPATGDFTYDAYLAAAKKIGAGEPNTPDNGPVIGGVHATATGSPVPDLTATSASSASSSSSTSGAMKVTTSIGFALFAAVLGIAMA